MLLVEDCSVSISSMVSETKRENKEPTRSLGVYIYMCVNLRRLLPRPHLYGGVGGTRALAHSIMILPSGNLT